MASVARAAPDPDETDIIAWHLVDLAVLKGEAFHSLDMLVESLFEELALISVLAINALSASQSVVDLGVEFLLENIIMNQMRARIIACICVTATGCSCQGDIVKCRG